VGYAGTASAISEEGCCPQGVAKGSDPGYTGEVETSKRQGKEGNPAGKNIVLRIALS